MPAHYLVADANGDAFVWQYSNLRNRPYIRDLQDVPLCVTNHQLARSTPPEGAGLAESVRRPDHLSAFVSSTGKFDEASIRAANHAVEQVAPAGQGLYASIAPSRTLWTALWNANRCSVEIDFYLSESVSEEGGVIDISRSAPITFGLD